MTIALAFACIGVGVSVGVSVGIISVIIKSIVIKHMRNRHR